jgi:hypothetical protein
MRFARRLAAGELFVERVECLVERVPVIDVSARRLLARRYRMRCGHRKRTRGDGHRRLGRDMRRCRRDVRGRGGAARSEAEQVVHPADHERRLDRLLNHAVRPAGSQLCLVDILERPGQHEHRDVLQLGLAADVPRQVVAADLRQRRRDQHDVGPGRRDSSHGLPPVGGGDDRDRLAGECQRDHALHGDVVVREQKSAHGPGYSGVSAAARRTWKLTLAPWRSA